MKYVLDASVALKWVLSEDNSDKALAIRDNARRQVDELFAPDFFAAECGHACFRAERRKILSVGDARKCLTAILADCPYLQDSFKLIPRAAAICQQWQTGFYDAIYVALAEREGCQLITADDKLVAKVQADLPFVVDLAEYAA
jgi:predicted nucleic acid-binding protein